MSGGRLATTIGGSAACADWRPTPERVVGERTCQMYGPRSHPVSPWRFLFRDAQLRGFRALLGDLHVAPHRIGADDVGIRIAGLARLQRRELGLRAVVLRVVRDQ